MNAGHGAEEHLRAIRQLMERATVYRTISAPTALVGGLLSILATAGLLRWQATHGDRAIEPRVFFAVWAVVLLLTAAANTIFILRGALHRGEPLVSAGMKHALISISPSFAAGGVISACLLITAHDALLPVLLWVAFYGVGLLATMSFAPRSIIVLGGSFLITAIALFAWLAYAGPVPLNPTWIMGVTFGGYHLWYAIVVWVVDRRSALDAVEDRPLVAHSYPPLP